MKKRLRILVIEIIGFLFVIVFGSLLHFIPMSGLITQGLLPIFQQ